MPRPIYQHWVSSHPQDSVTKGLYQVQNFTVLSAVPTIKKRPDPVLFAVWINEADKNQGWGDDIIPFFKDHGMKHIAIKCCSQGHIVICNP